AVEHAILVSSHALAEVETTCDRVVILHRGRVLAADRPAALAQRLRPASRVDVEAKAPPDALTATLGAVPNVRRADLLAVTHRPPRLPRRDRARPRPPPRARHPHPPPNLAPPLPGNRRAVPRRSLPSPDRLQRGGSQNRTRRSAQRASARSNVTTTGGGRPRE